MPYECDVEGCNFQSMNKKSLELHKEKEHPKQELKEKDKSREFRLGATPISKAKIKTITGDVLEGRIENITTYEIVLKTNDKTIIVFKGSVSHVEKLG